MRLLLKITAVTAILLLFLSVEGTPPLTYACTPTMPSQGPPPTITNRVNSADVIIIGTVIETAVQNYEESALVQVELYLKGTGDDAVEIIGFGDSFVCRSRAAIGDRLVFYVHQYTDGTLHADWLTAGGAIASPANELVTEISTITGQRIPTISSTPAHAPVADATLSVEDDPSTTNFLLLGAVALLIVLMVTTAVYVYRR